jgi:methyl-galactoside transport system substrate-binding protein
MKKLVALVLALVLVLSCTAVFAEAKTDYKVTVLVWKFDDTYGSSVRQAMLKWKDIVGEELGVNIELDMQDAGDDMAKQVEQCDQAIGKKPDFVIINLAEPAGGQTLVDKLTEANIPFLFYNIPPSDETYDSVVKQSGGFFIGTLPREAGDMQGEILAKLWEADPSKIDLNGDGKVQFVEFKGVANNPEAIARTQYSEETAEELGVPLEMVTDVIVADWDSTKANDAMLSTWQSHPEIELVFANNDDMAIGVIAALNQSGYNTGNEGDKAITVIGVDATDAAFEAIKAGRMTATVKQDGDAMGEANIRFMMNYLLNGTFFDDAMAEKYKLNEDGVSVFIPYSPITLESLGE